MRDVIIDKLKGIEQEYDVRILFSCESGSRAWGFESTDSDYDVRFLYVHPRDWYLKIDPGRDVIERPINDQLDVSGWDLKKALLLYRKSNPPLYEWLQSPIIYLEYGEIAQQLRNLIPQFYSPVACMYHYLHMAQGNYREYIKGDTVWIKKYFYLLRPLLACKWIEADLGPVPMKFDDLVEALIKDKALKNAIDELVAQKRAGDELGRGARVPVISQFIEAEIKRFEAERFKLQRGRGETDILNQLFLHALE